MKEMVTYLVTAGPTREPIDPVRFLSNPSSGKMGFAVAKEAKRRGARVILVCGPTSMEPPQVDEIVRVRTALDMMGAVFEFIHQADVLVMAAAVCDYRPADYSEDKIKKEHELMLPLVANPDIIGEVCKLSRPRVVVGFAAESACLKENAEKKLRRKNLDLIIANDITLPGLGFGSDYNTVTILDRAGGAENIEKISKEDIASRIINKIEILLQKRRST